MISRNAETVDGLQEYLSQIGFACSNCGVMNPLAEVGKQVTVLIAFPDDFPAHEVAAYLAMVRARRPGLKLVIISREPAVYHTMTELSGQPLNATVLPRPAFGWTIVDAIRGPGPRVTPA